MSEVQKPTVARNVIFHPEASDISALQNGATCIPGIVVQAQEYRVNLQAFPDAAGTLLRRNIPHVSQAQPGEAYWRYYTDPTFKQLTQQEDAKESKVEYVVEQAPDSYPEPEETAKE
ncbi:MAG: hypothetical protein AAFW00_19685 [Bacteroidota bacterium]